MTEKTSSEPNLTWQRWKNFRYSNEPYHLPSEGNLCDQGWHYFPTLCKREIVGHDWEIKENPDEKSCCPKCLALAKSKGLIP